MQWWLDMMLYHSNSFFISTVLSLGFPFWIMNTDYNLPGFMEGNIQPSSPSSLIAVWCIWALRDVSGSHRPKIRNKKMKVTPFKKRASEQLDEKGYSCLQFWNWTALFQRNPCFKVTKQRKLTHDLFFLKEIMIFHFYLEMTWPALEVSPFKPRKLYKFSMRASFPADVSLFMHGEMNWIRALSRRNGKPLVCQVGYSRCRRNLTWIIGAGTFEIVT